MYLNIGNDMAVRDSSVIGIFDLDNTTVTPRGREFLDKAEEKGEVVPCGARVKVSIPLASRRPELW